MPPHARYTFPHPQGIPWSSTKIYTAWYDMRTRCLNPRSKCFKRYGGRGITICARWMTFENFVKDMGEPRPSMSLERKDNDGPYSPGNCKWIPLGAQSSNTKHTHRITFGGVTRPLAHWAKIVGISMQAMRKRIERWGVRRAVTTPPYAACAAAVRLSHKAQGVASIGARMRKARKASKTRMFRPLKQENR